MYYSILAAIYNFFYATGENSHLAIIPELSSSSGERGALTMIRNAAFVLANMVMYTVLSIMLGTGKCIDFLSDQLIKFISKSNLAPYINDTMYILICNRGTRRRTYNPR